MHSVDTGFRRALSRSAQYWSSYSGYLREIREHLCHEISYEPLVHISVPITAQLCYALNRWNDIGIVRITRMQTELECRLDTARSFYRNATAESLNSFRLLNLREEMSRENLRLVRDIFQASNVPIIC